MQESALRKPGWVSFCGWAFIASWAFALGAVLVDSYAHRGPFFIHPLFVGSAELVSFPFLILWVLGSIVHSVRVRTARIKAEVLLDAAQKAGLTIPPAPGLPAKPAPGPRSVGAQLKCGECSAAPAMVRCMIDGESLCADCWGPHQVKRHQQPVAVSGR